VVLKQKATLLLGSIDPISWTAIKDGEIEGVAVI